MKTKRKKKKRKENNKIIIRTTNAQPSLVRLQKTTTGLFTNCLKHEQTYEHKKNAPLPVRYLAFFCFNLYSNSFTPLLKLPPPSQAPRTQGKGSSPPRVDHVFFVFFYHQIFLTLFHYLGIHRHKKKKCHFFTKKKLIAD